MTDAPTADPADYTPPKVWTWDKESGAGSPASTVRLPGHP